MQANDSNAAAQLAAAAAAAAPATNQTQEALKLTLTAAYLLIFFVGVGGNLCNCLVIADKKNRFMKTATNYYLFSLSVSDLILLTFGVPHDLVILWRPSPYLFSEFVCVSRGFISEASTYASVLVIVAFTSERYLAICHPLLAHTMSRLSRSVKIIVCIWLIASISAFLMARQFGIKLVMVNDEDEQQQQQHQESSSTRVSPPPSARQLVVECTTVAPSARHFELSFLVFFILPMAMISILYMRLGCHLSRKTRGRALSAARPAPPAPSDYKSDGPATRPPSSRLGRPLGLCQRDAVSMPELAAEEETLPLPLPPPPPPMPAVTLQVNSTTGECRSQLGAGKLALDSYRSPDRATPTNSSATPIKSLERSRFLSSRNSGRHRRRLSRAPNGAKGPEVCSSVSATNVKSVIKMLVSVVVMFFICWAPFHAQRLMAVYVTEPTAKQVFVFNLLNHISGISYYISAVANPILYRQAFGDTFGRVSASSRRLCRTYCTCFMSSFCKKDPQQQQQQHHTSAPTCISSFNATTRATATATATGTILVPIQTQIS